MNKVLKSILLWLVIVCTFALLIVLGRMNPAEQEGDPCNSIHDSIELSK